MTRTILPPALAVVLALSGAYAPSPAPPPKERPLPAAPVIEPFPGGANVLVWAGEPWSLTLGAGGDYACSRSGSEWVGRWSFRPGCRTLSIREQLKAAGPGGREMSWSVVLDALWEGTTTGDYAVAASLQRKAPLALGGGL